ncbi:uncharacterized protein BCR38DRAFT_78908 [Pseudomassariella vexata]|uniref:PAS domain-containing protein n=1 Tax=Pseudomassariella vexata TaxID=1141098 RepID=A0A1Y2DG94_9PEZI|nr:uncharacterized protein BCR38DRAFT_78908 [Pseudomassariella vexata]ORY58249.1 hypothetical protein BCR38DRAFT_78908 [Pseudomassariella vexata]
MEKTFMTIHNLSPDANILFASESIGDILGYYPHEIQGKSCFDYFHPDEVPFARTVHSRGVLLDKAAVLHYLRVRARDGQWVSCECCFTVVHDVLVACTSIYRRGEKSERRAIEAPQIRRIFSSSPRDPRYHMLEHLSPKFKMPPMEREPRAALILNRFSRNLPVMFATNAVASILGVRPDQIQGKSFYECIAENCYADAVGCLESAKSNDSIAYLRFWYRDPRRQEDFDAEHDGEDEEANNQEANEDMPSSNSSDSDGGVHLDSPMDIDSNAEMPHEIKNEPMSPDPTKAEAFQPLHSQPSSSTASSLPGPHSYQPSVRPQSPAVPPAREPSARPAPPAAPRRRPREPIPTFELEAVVSCTSDGLVVVLRKARPPIPALHPPLVPVDFENGLFAAPWGAQPISPYYSPERFHHFSPPLMPQYMPLQDHIKAAGGPPIDQLMRSIRDVAVFAWALVGINGKLAAFSRGTPRDDAQPPDGLPIWDPNAGQTAYQPPENQAARRWRQLEQTKMGPPHMAGYNADAPRGFGAAPGFNNTNYTYSHQFSWSHSTYTPAFETGPAYTHQHLQQPAYRGHPQQQQQWTEPSAPAYDQPNSNSSPPATQPPSPEEPPHYRYQWS